jgi:hypothetical protein
VCLLVVTQALAASVFNNMANSKPVLAMSFDEIIKGRESLVRMTSDKLLYAVDLAMVGTGKSRNYSGQVKDLG